MTTASLWNNNSEFSDLGKELSKRLIAHPKNILTPHGELLSALFGIYHDRYNNGFGNGPFENEFKSITDHKEQIEEFVSWRDYNIFIDEFKYVKLGEKIVSTPWDGDEVLEKVANAIIQAVEKMDKEYDKHYRVMNELAHDLSNDNVSEEDHKRALKFSREFIKNPKSDINKIRDVALLTIESVVPDFDDKPKLKAARP